MISVLIAAVGIFGTAIGAALTAAIAAKSDGRRQAALERQHAREQQAHADGQLRELRSEHLRWRRERRQTAYLDLLEALSSADRANQRYFRVLRSEPEPVAVDEARLAEIRELFKGAEQAHYKVILEGPHSVAQATHALLNELGDLVCAVEDFVQAHATTGDVTEFRRKVDTAGTNFMSSHRAFLDVARNALDEILDVP
ncbi:hypothetical protein [Nocardia canadensis]|uniref:hypothetical protein n=1 Tax=Nocardia canadensis TaxID=3065238 RepID=UPI0029305BDC|nr:hypothetical protein [Nocardia canadensis]